MTGFQLVAAQGLQNGEGLGPPNIVANYNSYQNLDPVHNFSNIFNTLNAIPTVIGTHSNPIANVTANLSLNAVNITIAAGDTLDSIVTDINEAAIPGIIASSQFNNLSITANTLASYTVTIGPTSNGFILANLGITVGSYSGTQTGITANSLFALNTLGANSFPHVFGQVPNDFSSNIGYGPLIDIAHGRTTEWFGGSPTANVYINTLSQAQTYATAAQAVLSSAATSQWPGGPAATATGGFSAIAGNNPTEFQSVANALSQLGTLMIPNKPFQGFSNAGCFQQILNSGNETIGNLHLNFFGKTIVDPSTGKIWTIGSQLFSEIIDNPVGMTADDTFQIAALNPLDALIGEAANTALTQVGDLDAVVTFFQLGNNVSSVYKWTDVLNIPLMLGYQAASVMAKTLGLSSINDLSAYQFIKAFVSNIPGFTNTTSFFVISQTMQQLIPLSNAGKLISMTTPLSQSDFANIQASFGPGSGTYGNPTVDDVLGSTNYNEALTNVVRGLQPLTTTTQWANISSDTKKISIALNGGSFPVILSNGNSYPDINSLAIGGATLINATAAELATLAPSMTDVSLFTSFTGIAETHNNSAILTNLNSQSSSFIPINVDALATNLMANYKKVSGLVNMVMGIFFQVVGISFSVYMDTFPHPALYLKVPGVPNSLTSFASTLSTMAALTSSMPGADEITGLGNVVNCLDMSTVAGQALGACVTEVQNAQVLAQNGLGTHQNLATNTGNTLKTAATGANTIGGGLING